MTDPLERFLAFVQRELGAEDASVVAHDAPPDERMRAALPDGRIIAVRFGAPPKEAQVVARRLEMLASSFAEILPAIDAAPGEPSRPSIEGALHHALETLVERAEADGGLVVDAHSPAVWGATGVPGETPLLARLIEEIHARPEMESLRRGRPFHHVVRDQDFGYVARSLAGIYILALAFDHPFDELRAERAILEGKEKIERLVLALPPRDPTPEPRAAVLRMRRRR